MPDADAANLAAPPSSTGSDVGRGLPLSLLDASHVLPPDRLHDLVQVAAQQIGASGASMWLIDRRQAYLMPPPPPYLGHDEPNDPIPVAGTLAGRAFSINTPMTTLDAPVVRWVPLIDGTERLGVVRSVFPDGCSEDQALATHEVADLIGDLLVSKSGHTDGYELQRRTDQMSLAAEMQWRQLPPLASATENAAVAGFVEPAYSTGGDGLDFAFNGDRLHLAIFDAVGHGLHASVISALTMASLRHGRRSGLDLVDQLASTDDAIVDQFPGDFVTAQVAILSTSEGVLRWANAGHPPPMLIRRGRLVGELDCRPRPPLGLFHLPRPSTTIETVHLEPHDRVLFYTDGLVEGGRRGGERFGVERLAELISQYHQDELDCDETVRRLGHAVLEHAAHQLTDDATMLLVEWRGRH